MTIEEFIQSLIDKQEPLGNDFEVRELSAKFIIDAAPSEAIAMWGSLKNARRVIYKAIAYVQKERRKEVRK